MRFFLPSFAAAFPMWKLEGTQASIRVFLPFFSSSSSALYAGSITAGLGL
jgi:hypothetical protein